MIIVRHRVKTIPALDFGITGASMLKLAEEIRGPIMNYLLAMDSSGMIEDLMPPGTITGIRGGFDN